MSEPQSLPFEPAPPPPKIAAKVGGWVFPLLLRSPLHRLLPHHLLLLTVTYRDTGQERTLPMEYHEVDGRMLVVSAFWMKATLVYFGLVIWGLLFLGSQGLAWLR